MQTQQLQFVPNLPTICETDDPQQMLLTPCGGSRTFSPAPGPSCTDWPSPETLPPSGRRRRPSGRPWCSPFRRRPPRRGPPSLRMCRRWSSCPSLRRHPAAADHTELQKSSISVYWLDFMLINAVAVVVSEDVVLLVFVCLLVVFVCVSLLGYFGFVHTFPVYNNTY